MANCIFYFVLFPPFSHLGILKTNDQNVEKHQFYTLAVRSVLQWAIECVYHVYTPQWVEAVINLGLAHKGGL